MAKSNHGRLTLRAIEIFVAVIEEGSFSTGARRLGASTSSVSQQVTNLEAALGARLIDRAARPLALTPAGYVFQRRALAILDETARAQTELAELELTSLPELRLAIIEDFDAEVTPELVVRLSGALPGCNIIAHAGPSHVNLAALASREVDMVVAADIEAPPDWVEQHPILRDPYILVTAKDLLAEGEDAVAQLMTAPMVRYASSQLMGRQIETHLRRLRLAPARRFEFASNHSLMAAVARTKGWTHHHAARLSPRAPLPRGARRAAAAIQELLTHPVAARAARRAGRPAGPRRGNPARADHDVLHRAGTARDALARRAVPRFGRRPAAGRRTQGNRVLKRCRIATSEAGSRYSGLWVSLWVSRILRAFSRARAQARISRGAGFGFSNTPIAFSAAMRARLTPRARARTVGGGEGRRLRGRDENINARCGHWRWHRRELGTHP